MATSLIIFEKFQQTPQGPKIDFLRFVCLSASLMYIIYTSSAACVIALKCFFFLYIKHLSDAI